MNCWKKLNFNGFLKFEHILNFLEKFFGIKFKIKITVKLESQWNAEKNLNFKVFLKLENLGGFKRERIYNISIKCAQFALIF